MSVHGHMHTIGLEKCVVVRAFPKYLGPVGGSFLTFHFGFQMVNL